MTEEEKPNRDIGARLAILFVPIVLSAHLVSLLIPKPVAWAASIFLWMMAIYWIPSRAALRFCHWLVVVAISSILALVLATIKPDLF